MENVYSFTFIGLGKPNQDGRSNRLILFASSGASGRQGLTLRQAIEKLRTQAGAWDALLIDQGNDVFQFAEDKFTVPIESKTDPRTGVTQLREQLRAIFIVAGKTQTGTVSSIESSETDVQRVSWVTFCRELPRLLQHAPGKWVAFYGEQQVVLGDSKQEVYEQLKQFRCPLEEVIVRRIEPLGPPVDLRRFRGARVR